jgi:5-carboxymethyl-2-hydroxymuconate isomerase
MPHLTLEYSNNQPAFAPQPALAALNRAMLASGLFEEPDIKSRAVALDDFLVGTNPTPRAFAHVRIALLAGRSDAQRQALAAAVLAALSGCFARPGASEIQLSVETVNIDRASYAKKIIHAA